LLPGWTMLAALPDQQGSDSKADQKGQAGQACAV
jgi:hypothetical protein